MNGTEVPLALIATLGGIISTIVVALIWLLKALYNENNTTIVENTKVQKDANAANIALSNAINRLAESSEEQTRANRAQYVDQIKFQELVLKKLDTIDGKTDRNYSAVNNMTVKNQTVEKQTVVEVKE